MRACFPHTRGKFTYATTLGGWYKGFPHTRGKFTHVLPPIQPGREFPPYAGEVYPQFLTSSGDAVVSPIRGGSLPTQLPPEVFQNGFPHTRGKFTEVDGVEPENG